MTFRRFNWVVLTLSVLMVGAVAGLGYRADVYGVYRPTRGRSMVPLQNERLFKYLFAYDYIPQNFDAVLVGSSVTGNWETAAIKGKRVYNASLTGGNATEEALIVHKIVEHKCPSLVLFSIQPYLTDTAGKKTAFMEESSRWAGLGSLQLFKAYVVMWQESRGSRRKEFSPSGRDDYDQTMFNRARRTKEETSNDFAIQPKALKDYEGMVRAARTCGAKIVAFIPPVEQDFWELRPAAYKTYFKTVSTLFQPGEPIIDMNGKDLTAFRANQSNFADGIHLSNEGAKQMVSYLDEQLAKLGITR